MIFNICSVLYWSKEEVIQHYPCLKNFGYKEVERSVPTGYWIKDENGYSKLWQEGPPKIVYDPVIELNSLEELDELIKAVGTGIVVHNGEIEIYDGYRE